MKKFSKVIGIGIGVVAALVISASTAQAQPNLLVNGSFENAGGFTANPVTLGNGGIDNGWATFGFAQSDMSSSADSPLDGSYALFGQQAQGADWNNIGAYQVVDGVTAGTLYKFTAYALTDTPLVAHFGPIDIQIQFLDAGLNNLATDDYGWSPTGPQDAWTQYVEEGVAPAGTAYASVYLFFMDNQAAATENLYYDETSLVAVPEPATLALLGMGLAIPFYFIRRKS